MSFSEKEMNLDPYKSYSAEVLLKRLDKLIIGDKVIRDKKDKNKGSKIDFYLNENHRATGINVTFQDVKTNLFGIQPDRSNDTKEPIPGQYRTNIVVEKDTMFWRFLKTLDMWLLNCGLENNERYRKYCERTQNDPNKSCLDGEVDYAKWWFSTLVKGSRKPIGKELLESYFKGGLIKENISKTTGEKYEDTFPVKISAKKDWRLTVIKKYDEKKDLYSRKLYNPEEIMIDENLNRRIIFKHLTVRLSSIHCTNLGIGITGYAKFISFIEGVDYSKENLLPESFKNPLTNVYEEEDVVMKKDPQPPPPTSGYNTGYDYPVPPKSQIRNSLKDQSKIVLAEYKKEKMDEKKEKVEKKRSKKLNDNRNLY